ncbi:MAG TPA: NHL domain-containing thioredoxin family protein [Amycolatopsis sp.]|nr:NHL domain-containing thioredoxin family protein [Amycolatopsis sp.]
MRAPELSGAGWLNTGGKQIRLAELRGKIVLLDFWTSGCINCLHVLDELRPLEEEFADVLVTIGVHSPKFLHEGEPAAIEAAVRRYGVHHPVLNDPDLTTWQQYAVKAWPTLVLVDPKGYVVHVAAGEGHAASLRRVITELIGTHDGILRRGGSPYVPAEERPAELSFPAKAVVTAGGRILVADTAHHAIVEFASDGETVIRRFGSGERGSADGAFDAASFAEPCGLALLPADVAERAGYHLLVADTAGHLLRGIDLASGEVSTVAGTGNQWRDGGTEGKAREIDFTSPWDVVWWDDRAVVAMAGNHTLSTFDPVAGTVCRFAGTTVEGLRDGALDEAFFAQTSGLAVQGERLWLVDAETSALRWIENGEVHTAVGTDLFSFGYRDGDAGEALLQHPLGVGVLPDGTIAIADTYNGAIRRYDPRTRRVSTLADGFAEPSGLVVTDDSLLVVESAANRVRVLPLSGDRHVAGGAHEVRRPPSVLAPGEVELAVVFTPPPGEKLDSARLEVGASPPELLVEGGGTSTGLSRRITLAEGVEDGVLQIVAQAATCDEGAENPVCRVTRQDWGVPVTLAAGGPAALRLILAGVA